MASDIMCSTDQKRTRKKVALTALTQQNQLTLADDSHESRESNESIFDARFLLVS